MSGPEEAARSAKNARTQRRIAWGVAALHLGVAAVYWVMWFSGDPERLVFAGVWSVLSVSWIGAGFLWRSAELDWTEVEQIRRGVRS